MKITRTAAKKVLDVFKLDPNFLSGRYRRKHSSKYRRTMYTLSDPIDYLVKALQIELEHGKISTVTNVTDDSLEKTGRIVLAHLLGVEWGEDRRKWKPFPHYYDALIHMEKKR